jgi:hypothetical protein
MAETDGPGYFQPGFDPDNFILESAGIPGDPDKPPVESCILDALTVLAARIGDFARAGQKQELEFIFAMFSMLKKSAGEVWAETCGEDLFNDDNSL